MSITSNFDLNKLCRTCASPAEDMTSIYETDSNLICYADILMSSTPIKCYENDGLPTHICHKCTGEVDKFHKFKLKCLEVDQTFRNHENHHFQEVLIKTEAPDASEESSIYETTTSNCITTHCATSRDTTSHNTATQPQIDPLNALETHEFTQKPIKTELNEHEIASTTPHAAITCTTYGSMVHTSHTRAHTDVKPYTCSLCGHSFTGKQSLTVHMVRKHTKDRPFVCKFCDSGFKLKESLVRHVRTHTGEKRYACEFCDRCFAHKFTLVNHVRKHTGEKPYKCSVCGCSFKQGSTLRNHMRRHTGEKPYACTICGSAFNRKGTLTDHIRTHTGEKPYACEVCDCAFVLKTKLTVHMRKHT